MTSNTSIHHRPPPRPGSRVLSGAWLILAALIVIAALLLSAARLLLTVGDRYSHQIEIQVSHFVGLPVEVRHVTAAWSGLSPELRLEGAAILDGKGGTALLRLGEIRVVLDLWRSLVDRRLQPGSIALHDTRLSLVRRGDGRIGVQGFPEIEDAPDLVSLVLGQKRFVLVNVELGWDDLTDARPPVWLSNVGFELDNKGMHRRFHGNLQLPGTLGHGLALAGDMVWDPDDPGRAGGALFLRGADLQLDGWSALGGAGDSKLSGVAGVNAWLQLYRGRFRKIQVETSARNVVWNGGGEGGDRVVIADVLRGLLGLRVTEEGWIIDADELQMERGGIAWPVTDLIAVVRRQENGGVRVRANMDHADLSAAADLLEAWPGLPDSFLEPIHNLNPRGRVQDLKIELEQRDDALEEFALQGRFMELATDPWEQIPGISGANGTVRGNLDLGRLTIDSDALQVDAPHLFRGPLAVRTFDGAITWRTDASGRLIDAGHFRFENEDIAGEGRLGLRLPASGASPLMDLQLAVHGGRVGHTDRYLPAKRMPAAAVRWLDRALVSGEITSGGVLFHGRLADFPFSGGEGTFQANVNVDQAVLDYRDNWTRVEELEAELRFRNQGLAIHGSGGAIYNSEVLEVDAEIENLRRSGLRLDGTIRGPIADMLRYVRESPLNKVYGDPLGPVTAAGDGRMKLGLYVPLRRGNPPLEVEGTVAFSDDRLLFETWNIALEDIEGELRFSESAIECDRIGAVLKDRPVQLGIRTVDADGGRETRIELTGPLGVVEEIQGMGWPILSTRVAGATPWRALLRIPGKQPGETGRIEVELASDLKGASVDLPAPLGKAADSVRPLSVSTVLTGGRMGPLRARYGDDFSVILATEPGDKGPVVTRGGLRFGKAMAELPAAPVLAISGETGQLSLMEWIDFMVSGKQRGALPTRFDGLEVEYLHAFGLAIERLRISARESEEGWRISLQGPSAEGTMQWNQQTPGKPLLQMDMKKLDVVVGPETARPPGNPGDVPALDISVGQASWSGIDLGKLVILTSPYEAGMRIERLQMDAEWAHVEASGAWRRTNGGQRSEFEVALTGDDLGVILDTFGYAGTIGGGRTDARLSGAWNGSPGSFELARLDGQLHLDVRKGRLLEVEPGAGRIFGLLSLQALPRRLLGDFGDLFRKGFSFDRISGRFDLEAGNAYTNDLLIDGPAAQIAIAGRTGIAARDYDQVITVMPKVRSTLPLAGALAAGPVAGAAILLADQILESVSEGRSHQGTSYRLTGSWDEPLLERMEKASPEGGFAEDFDE